MSKNKSPVSFHDSPPAADATARYKKAISAAKQGVAESRKEGIAGAPSFSQVGESWTEHTPQPARQFLREETKSQLNKLSEAMKQEQTTPENKEITNKEVSPETPEKEESKSESEQLKDAVESRVSKLDIGQYIMSGVATQTVPIISDKLSVVFRTITDAEEVYVDKALAQEKEITNRQFIRRNNEYALAMHIHSVNGNSWPNHVNSRGDVDLDIMEIRIGHVRKLSSPIFNLLVDNLTWFLQRVHKELTFEVLGNG